MFCPWICPLSGVISSPTCVPCSVGTYSTGGQSVCSACAQGTYTTMQRASSVDACKAINTATSETTATNTSFSSDINAIQNGDIQIGLGVVVGGAVGGFVMLVSAVCAWKWFCPGAFKFNRLTTQVHVNHKQCLFDQHFPNLIAANHCKPPEIA